MTAHTEQFSLRLERLIAAPRQQVFDAWTRPELLARWSAPEGMTLPEGSIDFRVGGRFRAVMQEPDGTRHVAVGQYREITPPERLVYTHMWQQEGESEADARARETVLTVEFHEQGERTLVVLRQDGFLSAAARDGHRVGWTSALKNLEQLFSHGNHQENQIMRTQDLLTRQYEMLYGTSLPNLEGMSSEDAQVQAQGGANSASWVLGHLITVHNGAMHLMGEEPVVPDDELAGAAPEPADRPDAPMDWSRLTSRFVESRERCLAGIAALSDAQLAEPVPHPFGGECSRAELLQLIAMHGTYHAGQLAMCRRAAGRAGVIKGPSQVAKSRR